MKVAIEGCAHGELDKIYESIEYIQKTQGTKIDLLICCGDFQAVRNSADLESLNVKPKYRSMQSFHKYYSGEKVAPVLTIFVGGNHEASNYLWELYYGGWVAPNIYYMGYSSVIRVGDLRIAGISGIFKDNHYRLGHYEFPPYNDGTIRSVYHIREFEIFKLRQISSAGCSPVAVDVFVSHDWPKNIVHHGNKEKLLKYKPFLRQDVETGALGNPPLEDLMHTMHPSFWFAAHLHTKFPALFSHSSPSVDAQTSEPAATKTHTRFLALDKCLPRRDFLQVLDILPHSSAEKTDSAAKEGGESSSAAEKSEEAATSVEIQYDVEWLAILRLSHKYFSIGRHQAPLPSSLDRQELEVEMDWIRARAESFEGGKFKNFDVPRSAFVRTVDVFDPRNPRASAAVTPSKANPQTLELLRFLDLDDKITPPSGVLHFVPAGAPELPGEDDADSSSDEEGPAAKRPRAGLVLPPPVHSVPAAPAEVSNPEEIEI